MSANFEVEAQELSKIVREIRDEKNSRPLKDFGGIEKVCELIKTNTIKGLQNSEEESKERKKHFGENLIPQPPITPFWKLFIGTFGDPMLIILLIMAIVSLVLGIGVPLADELQGHEVQTGELPWFLGWIEGFSILIAVGIVSIVGSVNDYQKELRFRELAQEGDKIDVNTIRNGDATMVMIDDIVVGDIVQLGTGDKIPADGLLLVGYDLKTNESSVTGETDMVKKDESNPLLLSGTEVSEGTGTMVVIAVGRHSEWGKTMAACTEQEKEETPLEQKLEGLARIVSIFAFLAAGLTLIVLFVGYFIKKFFPWTWSYYFSYYQWNTDYPDICLAANTPNPNITSNANMTYIFNNYAMGCGAISYDLTQLLDFAILSITIVVAAVPEGLPLAVTISLAYSVRKMLNDKNLVRKLVACETMGGATTICSDKTGTLTKNEMRVTHTWIAGTKYFAGSEDKLPEASKLDSRVTELISHGISTNCTANLIIKSKSERDPNIPAEKQLKASGSKTECALLFFVNDSLKLDYKKIKETYELNGRILKKYSFSSKLKRMSCIVADNQNKKIIYTKGASEVVLSLCDRYLNKNGEILKITEKRRKKFDNMILHLASQGLRTLSLAFRPLEEKESSISPDKWERDWIENNLILYQIVGIKDPLREEVPNAVKLCQKAGIVVRMVTGDNINTARFIAKDCGILKDDGICIEGPKFRNLTDEELDQILPNLQVMARSAPTDKLKLVRKLVNSGEVVAVTGDGTNDGPALKGANVGLSMGLSGTAVAKAASDIVIQDDNFASIVKAVLWGRTIYDNIRKFLQFQLTVNFTACTLSVICAITQFISMTDFTGEEMTSEIPFTAIQLLWVNLIMDTLAALALATEKPVVSVLDRLPYSKNESFISFQMWVSILSQTVYQLIILLFIHYLGIIIPEFQVIDHGYYKNAYFNGQGWEVLADSSGNRLLVKNTLVFNTFVFLQVFNEIPSRRLNCEWNIFENIFDNWMYLLIFFGTILLQVFIVEIGLWNIGNIVFGTTGLTWFQWLFSVALAAGCIPFHYCKIIVVKIIQFFWNLITQLAQNKKKKNNNSVTPTETELKDM